MAAIILHQPRSLIVPYRGFRKPVRPVLDPQHPLSRGLIGCWLLGDGVGSGRYTDIAQFGFHGTGVPGTGVLTKGPSHHGGFATDFGGSTDLYIDVPAPDAPFLGPITYVAMIYVRSLSGYNTIVSKSAVGGATNNPGEFRTEITLGTLAWVRATASGFAYTTSGNAITANTWWQVAVILTDGLCETLPQFYIQAYPAGYGSFPAVTTGQATGTNVDLWIGNRPDNVTPMNGLVDGLRAYRRALNQSELQALLNEPYAGIYESYPAFKAPAIEAAIDYLRPDGEISTGGWTTNTGGTNLHVAIDEVVPDDSDYIHSAPNPHNDVCEVSLQNQGGPLTTPYKLHYRYERENTNQQIDLVVKLIQGTTVVAGPWTHTNIGTIVQAEQTLTGPEAAAVTNFNDLRVRFTANAP